MEKIYFGYLSIALGLSAFFPYIYFIYKKQIRPHAFSYLIWILTAGGLAVAQTMSGAGSGAWLTYLYAISCAVITLLAFFYHGQRNIYKSDWACLFLALFSIVLWWYTQQLLLAILLLTFIDAIGYIPTIIKTYHHPKDESQSMFIIGLFSAGSAIAAIQIYSLNTLAYPVTIILLNLVVILLTVRPKKINAGDPSGSQSS